MYAHAGPRRRVAFNPPTHPLLQALIASCLASGKVARARMVVSRSLLMAGGLGVALAIVLMASRHAVARAFTTDPLVLLFISGEGGLGEGEGAVLGGLGEGEGAVLAIALMSE